MSTEQFLTLHITQEDLTILFKAGFIIVFLMVMYFSREEKNQEVENHE